MQSSASGRPAQPFDGTVPGPGRGHKNPDKEEIRAAAMATLVRNLNCQNPNAENTAAGMLLDRIDGKPMQRTEPPGDAVTIKIIGGLPNA